MQVPPASCQHPMAAQRRRGVGGRQRDLLSAAAPGWPPRWPDTTLKPGGGAFELATAAGGPVGMEACAARRPRRGRGADLPSARCLVSAPCCPQGCGARDRLPLSPGVCRPLVRPWPQAALLTPTRVGGWQPGAGPRLLAAAKTGGAAGARCERLRGCLEQLEGLVASNSAGRSLRPHWRPVSRLRPPFLKALNGRIGVSGAPSCYQGQSARLGAPPRPSSAGRTHSAPRRLTPAVASPGGCRRRTARSPGKAAVRWPGPRGRSGTGAGPEGADEGQKGLPVQWAKPRGVASSLGGSAPAAAEEVGPPRL